jgi:hypothetical protein
MFSTGISDNIGLGIFVHRWGRFDFACMIGIPDFPFEISIAIPLVGVLWLPDMQLRSQRPGSRVMDASGGYGDPPEDSRVRHEAASQGCCEVKEKNHGLG